MVAQAGVSGDALPSTMGCARGSRRYDMPDQATDAEVDDLVAQAADLFDGAYAALNVLIGDRVWTWATTDVTTAQFGPCQQSVCTYTIDAGQRVVVEDASTDPRLAEHPAVTGPLGLRFYAGAP